jgi:hypothetical protein
VVIDGAQCQKQRFLASCYRLAEAQFGAYPNFQTVSEEVFSETGLPEIDIIGTGVSTRHSK